MTGAPTPMDTGNSMLTEGPAQQTCAVVQTPAGPRLMVTVRTSSATVTVFLRKEDTDNWARAMAAAARQVSASGLIVPGGIAHGNGYPRGGGHE